MILLEHNPKASATLAAYCSGGRLPHGILLEGPEGCGKKTAAALISQIALCVGENPPCGQCTHCVKVEKRIHPDVRVFTVPEGKKEFPVDLVREIRQEAYIAPNEGRCKIYLLDKAHTMNVAAQNALLKLIEEPPRHVRFLLLCENRSMMLPTILSRVVSIELLPPDVAGCEKSLGRLAPESTPEQRRAAAAGAGGNIGRALALLGTAKPSKAAADVRQLRRALIEGDRYRSLRILAGYDKDREGVLQLFVLLREEFAHLALARWRGADEEETALLGRVTPNQAQQAARAVETAAMRAGRNVGIALLCACLTEEIKYALEGD